MTSRALWINGSAVAAGFPAPRLRDSGASPLPLAETASLTPGSLWTVEQVRTQLGRILSSSAFDASTRNRGFLKYVVDETLVGRADRIKGYTVGQVVFQRGADFDPQRDPVVRTEAANLRRSLERYYLTAGKDDRLVIHIPKGRYVPRFETRGPEGGSQGMRPSDNASWIAIARDRVVRIENGVLAALWLIALLLLVALLR